MRTCGGICLERRFAGHGRIELCWRGLQRARHTLVLDIWEWCNMSVVADVVEGGCGSSRKVVDDFVDAGRVL